MCENFVQLRGQQTWSFFRQYRASRLKTEWN